MINTRKNPKLFIKSIYIMDFTTLCSRFFDNDKNKQQLKVLLKPMVNMILHELKPYIYALVIFISIMFLLMMSIFVLLLKLYLLKHSYIPV